ncbi:MAG: hypothetical protein Q7O66_15360, partial [Dehalococcoidia bacterium]|nr:hypothetical protein [Dehalococcoidia bacterium]
MDQWLSEQEYWLSPKNKRLQDLQRQFPKLPMAVIIQNDVMRCGVRPSQDIWEIEGANKAAGVAFQNRDHGQFFTTKEHQVRPTGFCLPEDT